MRGLDKCSTKTTVSWGQSPKPAFKWSYFQVQTLHNEHPGHLQVKPRKHVSMDSTKATRALKCHSMLAKMPDEWAFTCSHLFWQLIHGRMAFSLHITMLSVGVWAELWKKLVICRGYIALMSMLCNFCKSPARPWLKNCGPVYIYICWVNSWSLDLEL